MTKDMVGISIGVALCAFVCLASCGSDVANGGCVTDFDCRGNRICEAEVCVDAPASVFDDTDDGSSDNTAQNNGGENNGGENNTEGPCDAETACPAETLCEAGSCLPICGDEQDCEAGRCTERADGPGRVCVPGLACLDRVETETDDDDGACIGEWSCNDGSTRTMLCERIGNDAFQCECIEDGSVGATFRFSDSVCYPPYDREIALNLCEWEELAW